jgi:hypothetical protein
MTNKIEYSPIRRIESMFGSGLHKYLPSQDILHKYRKTLITHTPFEALKKSIDTAKANNKTERLNMINRYNIPKEYQTKKNEVWDEELRNTLKKLVRIIGADWDGDIVYYRGNKYFIDVSRDIVKQFK